MAFINPFRARAASKRGEADQATHPIPRMGGAWGEGAHALPTRQEMEGAEGHARLAEVELRTRRARALGREAAALEVRAQALDAAIGSQAKALVAGKSVVRDARSRVVESHKAFIAAVRAADEALREVRIAAEVHGRSVTDTAHVLNENGLPLMYRDGDIEHRFDTGGTGNDLTIDGHTWRIPDPAETLARAYYGAVRNGLGAQAGYAVFGPLARRAVQQTGDLFDDAPLPEAVERVTPGAREAAEAVADRETFKLAQRRLSAPQWNDPLVLARLREQEAELGSGEGRKQRRAREEASRRIYREQEAAYQRAREEAAWS